MCSLSNCFAFFVLFLLLIASKKHDKKEKLLSISMPNLKNPGVNLPVLERSQSMKKELASLGSNPR